MRFKLRPNFFWVFAVLFFVFLVSSDSAYAAWRSECLGGTTGVGIDATDVATLKGVECVFENAVSVILALAGIVVFIMFLIGGFKYLTSGGDPKALEGAKGTLTHAILGLIVLVFAFLILVIIQAVTGINVTQFRISTD